MLKTNQPLPRTSAATRRPERIAWLILVTSFSIFSLLCASFGVLSYRWWTQPRGGVVEATVQQELFVQVQKAGLVQPVVLQGGELHPDDRVLVSDAALPGPATTLRFGSATVALWAGTDLHIGHFQRQWNDRSAATAQFELDSGQILVDIAGADELIEFQIGGNLGGRPVLLSGPGRYRIRILDPESPTTAVAEAEWGRGLEVATERGLAQVGDVRVEPGLRLIEAGNRQTPLRNRWELLRDGNFQQLVDAVYGPVQQLAWLPSSNPAVVGAASSGQVRPTQLCADVIARTGCDEPYLRLVRMGGNTKGFVTAVKQQVDADVSAYRELRLKADIKIVSQSLSRAGESGTECPLLIRITYTNRQASNVQKDFCYWAFDHPNQNGVVANYPYIETQQIPPNAWYSVNIELKQDLPELAKIENVSFQANGHDYESQVRNTQLIGLGLIETPQP